MSLRNHFQYNQFVKKDHVGGIHSDFSHQTAQFERETRRSELERQMAGHEVPALTQTVTRNSEMSDNASPYGSIPLTATVTGMSSSSLANPSQEMMPTPVASDDFKAEMNSPVTTLFDHLKDAICQSHVVLQQPEGFQSLAKIPKAEEKSKKDGQQKTDVPRKEGHSHEDVLDRLFNTVERYTCPGDFETLANETVTPENPTRPKDATGTQVGPNQHPPSSSGKSFIFGRTDIKAPAVTQRNTTILMVPRYTSSAVQKTTPYLDQNTPRSPGKNDVVEEVTLQTPIAPPRIQRSTAQYHENKKHSPEPVERYAYHGDTVQVESPERYNEETSPQEYHDHSSHMTEKRGNSGKWVERRGPQNDILYGREGDVLDVVFGSLELNACGHQPGAFPTRDAAASGFDIERQNSLVSHGGLERENSRAKAEGPSHNPPNSSYGKVDEPQLYDVTYRAKETMGRQQPWWNNGPPQQVQKEDEQRGDLFETIFEKVDFAIQNVEDTTTCHRGDRPSARERTYRNVDKIRAMRRLHS